MGGSAVVVGATGQIGTAVVERLVGAGWQVRAVSRGGAREVGRAGWPPEWGVRTLCLDRDAEGALGRVVGGGCDLLVDCVAYTSRHADQLVGLGGRVGSAVVISTCMVYRQDAAAGIGSPRWPLPMTEAQPVIAADDSTYAGGKAAVELVLWERAPYPVTVLRAGMVHGPYSSTPREWYFVKRALDRRPVRLLAHGGAGICHPTGTRNLAALVLAAAALPGRRVLNAGDPRPPSVREMAAHSTRCSGTGPWSICWRGPVSPVWA